MGLSGNLRTMDLPEILQWISGGRKTGTLHLERRSVQKRIGFKGGEMPTNVSVFIDLDVTGVILEGVRRVDEWQRIKEILPSTSVTFRVMIGHGLPESAVEMFRSMGWPSLHSHPEQMLLKRK